MFSDSTRAQTVLFARVHNAGRSQKAAAWFNLLSDPTKAARSPPARSQGLASILKSSP
jgi:protein-tyrosine-phosphatase